MALINAWDPHLQIIMYLVVGSGVSDLIQTLNSNLPAPQDQFFANRRLEQVAAQCSFVEAYVGGAFGYVQVTTYPGISNRLQQNPYTGDEARGL